MVDVNIIDGQSHKVSIYGVDWDSTTRAERIDVLNASTGAVLDGRNLGGFNGGAYLTWTVRGHVQLSVTLTGGVNAVVSGLFFDPVVNTSLATPTSTPTSTATPGPSARYHLRSPNLLANCRRVV